MLNFGCSDNHWMGLQVQIVNKSLSLLISKTIYKLYILKKAKQQKGNERSREVRVKTAKSRGKKKKKKRRMQRKKMANKDSTFKFMSFLTLNSLTRAFFHPSFKLLSATSSF